MSYYRLYPSKNNTLFRYSKMEGSNVISHGFETINCGANPVMELMDGKGESKLVFKFDINDIIVNRFKKSRSLTVKLQLWDAGTLWEPAIKLKNLKLEHFTEDFSEGDGYSFLKPEAKEGTSNWLNATSNLLWRDISPVLSTASGIALNRINEDLNFDVTEDFNSRLDIDSNPPANINFILSVDNREDDESNIYRKFIHSSYTKTVFKPYLEFFFDDGITDNAYNFSKTNTKVYLINKAGIDFSSSLTVSVTSNQGTRSITPISVGNGIYYANLRNLPYTPSTTTKKTILTVIWLLGGTEIYRQLVDYRPEYFLEDDYDIANLFFYPVTPSTHNTAKQGDILPFNIISEIRGDGTKVVETYEYRVTSMDGFEMVPWTKVNVYRDKMYFNIATDYFFPEQQYEVWVRNKTENFTLTSNLTAKFKLEMNDKSHMRDMSASPYYSRNQFFSK